MFVFFHVWYFDIFQGVWIFGVWYYGMSRSQTDKVTRLDKNMPKTKCLDCQPDSETATLLLVTVSKQS